MQVQNFNNAWAMRTANKRALSVCFTARSEQGRAVFFVPSGIEGQEGCYFPVIHGKYGYTCSCSFFKEEGCCEHLGAVLLYVRSLSKEERKKLLYPQEPIKRTEPAVRGNLSSAVAQQRRVEEAAGKPQKDQLPAFLMR